MDIAQDRDGFIWFATRGGVCRYDGVEFESFSDASSNLSDDYVLSLLAEDDGRMWVGTSSGLNLYDPGKRDFNQYRLMSGGVNCANVRKVFRDASGTVWAGTRGALFRFDRGEDAFVPVERTAGMSVNYIADGPQPGQITFAGPDDVYVLSSDSLVRVGGFPADLKVRSMMRDRRGNLWVASATYGLFSLNRQLEPVSVFTTPELTDNYVRALAEDAEGNILIGTYGGLDVYSPSTGSFKSYRLDETSDTDALSFFSVNSLFCARDGTVWIGSYTGGADWFNPYESPFLETEPMAGLPEHYFRGNIGNLVAGAEGLWIATEGGGLLFREPGGKVRRVIVSGRPSDYRALIVSSLYRRNGDLWAGYNDGTVARLDAHNGRTLFRRVFSRDCPVIALFADIDGCVYAGTWNDTGNKNLVVMTPDGKVEKELRDSEGNPLYFRDVACILPCRDGSVLIGESDRDIILYNHHTGFCRTCEIKIPGGKYRYCGVNQMIRDRKGDLWIASSRYGLLCLDGESLALKRRWSVSEGLPSRRIVSLVEGEDGSIWCSSMSAVSCVNPSTGEVWNCELPGRDEFNRRSVASFGGDIFMGAGANLIRFNPFRGRSPEAPAAPKIISLLVNGEAADLGDGLGIGRHSAMTFYFRSPSYSGDSPVMYSYKIEGLDKDWTSVGPYPRVNVAGLAPGRYTFRTKAVRPGAAASVEGDAVPFRVRVPLWMRWWMLLIYAGIAALLVLGFRKWRKAVTSLDEERERLRDICDRMFRPSVEGSDYPAEGAFMERLYKCINDHISDTLLDLQTLVSEVGVSRTGLYYKVKKLSGLAPMDFVRKVRLDVSAELLSEGRYSVAEIADMVGFSSASHFSGSFKNRFGCSPSEYVKKKVSTNTNNQS